MSNQAGEYAGTATHRGGEIVAWRDVDTTRFEVRAKHATRDQARKDNGMRACSREFEDDENESHGIETLADLNRANRAKFARQSVRDHDLRHEPIKTLRDINLRWRQHEY